MSSSVSAHGPIFDGRAARAASDLAEESGREIARKGVEDVRHALAGVLRHPTGYYESRIHAEDNVITDTPVIYGPWLEGVGSRNRSTRFKGYWTFRRTTQRVQAHAVPAAENLLHAKYLRRMQ